MDAILTFHSLDDSGSVVSFPADRFARLLERLLADGVSIVRLDELTGPATERASTSPTSMASPVPPPAPAPTGRHRVALTFDDGYRNVLEQAAPILARWELPALLYVVSDRLGDDNRWFAQGAGVPRLPLLDGDGLRAWVAAGHEVGAHSASHPHLARLDDAVWHRELRGCRDRLEAEAGVPVRHFAYPYGAAGAEARRRVGEVYDTAVTTRLAFLRGDEDRLALPRLDAYYLRGAPDRSLFSTRSRARLALRAVGRRVRRLGRDGP